MRMSLKELPVMMDMPGFKSQGIPGMGGMIIAYAQAKADFNGNDFFKGLPGDSCPVPHWCYMLKGSMKLQYLDGKEEIVNAGDVAYLPSGHKGWLLEDCEWIEISPEKDMTEMREFMAKKMQGK